MIDLRHDLVVIRDKFDPPPDRLAHEAIEDLFGSPTIRTSLAIKSRRNKIPATPWQPPHHIRARIFRDTGARSLADPWFRGWVAVTWDSIYEVARLLNHGKPVPLPAIDSYDHAIPKLGHIPELRDQTGVEVLHSLTASNPSGLWTVLEGFVNKAELLSEAAWTPLRWRFSLGRTHHEAEYATSRAMRSWLFRVIDVVSARAGGRLLRHDTPICQDCSELATTRLSRSLRGLQEELTWSRWTRTTVEPKELLDQTLLGATLHDLAVNTLDALVEADANDGVATRGAPVVQREALLQDLMDATRPEAKR